MQGTEGTAEGTESPFEGAHADGIAGTYRQRKLQRRVRIADASERNLAFALSEINNLALALELPESAREASARLYRRISDGNLTRGRSTDVVVAATLYAGCRECRIPVKLSDFEEASGIPRRSIGRTYRSIVDSLHISMEPENPEDFIDAICDRLNRDGETRSTARGILMLALDNGAGSGCTPSGLAAASVYLACERLGIRETKKNVAKAAGITQMTMDARCRDISSRLDVKV